MQKEGRGERELRPKRTFGRGCEMKESREGWGFLGGNDREGSLECGAVVAELWRNLAENASRGNLNKFRPRWNANRWE